MTSLPGNDSAVLDPVQDAARRLRRCPASGHPGTGLCARRSARKQVGTEGWPQTVEQRDDPIEKIPLTEKAPYKGAGRRMRGSANLDN